MLMLTRSTGWTETQVSGEMFHVELVVCYRLLSTRVAALLQQKVEEVGKMTESRRREQEKSYRLVGGA